jgi:prevent-host-death family protein
MKFAHASVSLSTFKGDTTRILRRLKKTGQPLMLMVDGKPEVVVQDAESYWKLVETVDPLETIEGIKRGLESMK